MPGFVAARFAKAGQLMSSETFWCIGPITFTEIRHDGVDKAGSPGNYERDCAMISRVPSPSGSSGPLSKIVFARAGGYLRRRQELPSIFLLT